MNPAILSFLRGATLLGWLVLALGDSLVHSKDSVELHFKRNQHYLYAAAQLSVSEALVALYRRNQDVELITRAAKQNHPEAISLLYQHLRNDSATNIKVWRNKAIEAGVSLAIYDYLVELTGASLWADAQDLAERYDNALSNLKEPQLSQYKLLKRSIEFRPNALSDKLDRSVSRFEYGGVETGVSQCVMHIALLVQSPDMLGQAQTWVERFKSSNLSSLPICWLSPKVSPELVRICASNKHALIDCSMQNLARNYRQYFMDKDTQSLKSTHLMVMTDTGDANTRGGLMLISKEDNYSVFIHEFAHWLNYFDEYQVAKAQQKLLCKTKGYKRLGHNLILAKTSLTREFLERETGQRLYPAKTCEGTDVQAYKVFAANTFMEYLDTPMSRAYVQHIVRHFEPTKLVPVAMNFALTFQYHDSAQLNVIDKEYWQQQYEYWLSQAADHSFPPAMRLLSQLRRKQQADRQAKTLLFGAANLGDTTSQVLLGHIYLEGVWIERDLQASASWYRRAALADDPYGLYFYGKCFEMGWGCPKSSDIAKNWFVKAANLGSELAIKKLETFGK